MGKNKDLSDEFWGVAFLICFFLTVILIAVFRKDYTFTMFMVTQPIAMVLAAALLDIFKRRN